MGALQEVEPGAPSEVEVRIERSEAGGERLGSESGHCCRCLSLRPSLSSSLPPGLSAHASLHTPAILGGARHPFQR